MATNQPAAVSYEPPQNELNYYEELFNAADTAKTGEINGRDAVTFLSRSKLPVDLLRNIWNMADQNPKTNSLDKRKFFTSVRLIQLFQNGQKAQGPNLMCADATFVMRPPFFENLTGVSIQPFAISAAAAPVAGQGGFNTNAPGVQGQGQQVQAISPPVSPEPGGVRRDSQLSHSSQQGLISSPVQQTQQPVPSAPVPAARALTQDPYLMLPGEQVRYESHFPQYEKDGFVYGKEAVDLFSKSGLAKEVLRDIWNLVDNPVDNRLSRVEFAIAMHLIVCISKKNLPLPPVLPPSLVALKSKASNVANSVSPPAAPLAQGGSIPQQGPVSMPSPPPSHQSMQVPAVTGASSMQAPPLNGGSSMTMGMLRPSSISDAFEGMQGNGMHRRSSSAESVPTPPLNNTTGSGPGTGQSNQEELEKVRSVLQKLQAENISLKAQLGQCSDEEKQVRDEIARTVNEIGTLSQELTSLRSQVVDAKASLIEASAELKAQLEKRDLLKTLVSETSAMKEAFQTGLQTIHDAEEIAKAKRGASPHVDSSTAAIQSVNPFGDAGSVLTDTFADASSFQHSVSHVQREQLPPQQMAPVNYYEQQVHQAPVPPQKSGPSEESLRRLEELKIAAQKAEEDATSADDHAKALALQFEDIRAEAERANAIANDKQNAKPKKKKGLRRGGKDKKEQKRELESALQNASQKNDEANRAHYDLRNAEANAGKLMAEAQQKRAVADAYEMQLAEEASAVHPSVPTPLSREEFGAAARGQDIPEAHTHNPYATSATPYKNTTMMGYGGYPGTPAAPGIFDGAPMGSVNEGLMGGSVASNHSFAENLMGGSAANPTDSSIMGGMSHAGSVSYVGAPSITSERDGHPSNHHEGVNNSIANTTYPTDASYADMSNTGASYEAARYGAETSNVFPTESSVAGLSYTSASLHGTQNQGFPAESSVAGVSNAGTSYVSASHAEAQNSVVQGESSVAGLSYTSAPHSVAETSFAGVSYASIGVPKNGSNDAFEHNSLTAQQSVDTFEHNSQSQQSLTAQQSADTYGHYSQSQQSLNAQQSADTFEYNGQSQQSLTVQQSDENVEHNGPSQFDIYGASYENPSVLPGILAPAPSHDSAHNSAPSSENLASVGSAEKSGKDSFGPEAFEGIPSPEKNIVSENNPPTNAMLSMNLGHSISQESELTNTSTMNGQSSNNGLFGGIPSPPKESTQGGMGDMTGFGMVPSNSISDGIPSPTGSSEYANPFAQQN